MQTRTKNRTNSFPGAVISQLPNGKYQGFLRKMVEGKRKKSPVFTASSFVGLKQQLQDWEYAGGFNVIFTAGPITTHEHIEKWLENKYKSLAPNTIDLYKTTWNKYLSVAPFGKTPLVELSKVQLSNYFRDLEASASVKSRIYKLLKTCLKSAVKNDVLKFDATDFAEPPQKPKQADIESFSQEEQQRLIDFTKNDEIWHPIIVLALDCGLRESELFGLRKSDFDMKLNRLTIKRSVDRLKDGASVKERLKTDTKREPITLSVITL